MHPLVYFAALYYQAIIQEADVAEGFNESIRMKSYKFIKWNSETIKTIKRDYFKVWKVNRSIQRFHALDMLNAHHRYSEILYLNTPVHTSTAFSTIVSSLAMLETFNVCQADRLCDLKPQFIFDASLKAEYVDLSAHLILSNFEAQRPDLWRSLIRLFNSICDKTLNKGLLYKHLNLILLRSLHHFVDKRMDLCQGLLCVFANMADRDGLLLVSTVQHYSFVRISITYLQSVRSDWYHSKADVIKALKVVYKVVGTETEWPPRPWIEK